MPRRYFTTIIFLLLTDAPFGCSRGGEASSTGKPPAETTAPRIASSASAVIATAPTPAVPTEQRFPLRDGQIAVVNSEDHVLILNAGGDTVGESWCGANGINYRRAVAFLAEVVRLVEASDKNALADLVSFPLRASVPVKTRTDFLTHYGRIFSPAEVDAISRADPGALFCKNGAFMLGDGAIWARPNETGAYRLVTVNQAVRKPQH